MPTITQAVRKLKANLPDLLPERRLLQIAQDIGIRFRQRTLTPAVTSALFLQQVLHGNVAVAASNTDTFTTANLSLVLDPENYRHRGQRHQRQRPTSAHGDEHLGPGELRLAQQRRRLRVVDADHRHDEGVHRQ
jgi:hypothetical protein